MIRLLLLLTAAVACAQPPFAPFGVAVRNAADNSSKDVAPGSLITIMPLAPEIQSLAGIEVKMRFLPSDPFRPLTTFPAPQSGSLWAVVPNDAPTGDFWVTLFRGDVMYTDYVLVRREAPRLFTQNYTGFGPALALNYIDATPTRNALTAAAVPGRFVALFATGLSDARAADVTVDIAGQTVPASYAGPQGTPGLDQVNFIVPQSAYLGCYVPVTLRVRGTVSRAATLSIHTDTFACAHPLGLSYEDMRTLDAGRTIPFANLSLSVTQSTSTGLTERASLMLTDANTATVALYSGVQAPESTFLTCSPPLSGAVGAVRGAQFDIAPVTLKGPRGQEFELARPYVAAVPSIPSRFFTPGQWSMRGSGGDLLFPFERSFALPPVIDSLNVSPGAVLSPEEELEIRWNGTVFGPNDLVTVYAPGGACTVRAWDGHATLPKPIRSTTNSIVVSVFPHPLGRTVFDLLQRDGRIMRGVVSYSFSLEVPVVVEPTLR